MRKFIGFLILSVTLAACASPAIKQARLSPELAYSLPSDPWAGPETAVFQQVTLNHDGQLIQLQALILLEPGDVRILLLDPAGRRALDLRWGPDNLVAHKASWLQQTVTAEDVLARLVLAFWPIETATVGLPEGAEITKTPGGRLVTFNGSDVIVITKDNPNPWLGTTVITQEGSSFSLTITSRLKDIE